MRNSTNPIQPIDTREALAKIAGVSHDTIHKVEKVITQAEPGVKEKMLTVEVSVNQAYADVRQAERKTEIVEGIKTVLSGAS